MIMPGKPRVFYRDVVYHRKHSGHLTLEEIPNVPIIVDNIGNRLTVSEPSGKITLNVIISSVSFNLSTITMTSSNYAYFRRGVRWVTVKGEFTVSSDNLMYDPKIYIRRCRKDIGDKHDELREELQSLDLEQLRSRANGAGLEEDTLEALLDGDNPEQALIAALIRHANKVNSCDCTGVGIDEDPLIHLLKNSLCCKTRELDDGKTNLLA
jgi:hypothetical protein